MGRSSPPFLYDRPSNYNFDGPIGHSFDPRAVTRASWAPAQLKPQPEGPLINFNNGRTHSKPTWTPMSPHTKTRVQYARSTQLVLRLVAFVGALGSLFCSIVMTHVPTTVIWIIRAGPIVAILHTIYGIYHMSRSAVTRPPFSQASYGLFASTLDAGLIPFYIFTAFMAHEEWADNAYNWGTLFQNASFTVDFAEAMFICGAANAGLHLISFTLSIFLAVIFRKIAHLPPDMNPLEDNLTARPRKKRIRDEMAEKHMSQSTLNSTLEDPLIDPPRTIPFMHTRGQSLGSDMNHEFVDVTNSRQSQPGFYTNRLSNPETLFHQPASQPYDLTSAIPAPGYGNVTMHSPEFVNPSTHTRQLTSRAANRTDTVSPLSENWVAYSDRSPSPVSEIYNEKTTELRQSSSVYSRKTNTTTTSNGSGIRDWFGYGRKASLGSAILEDTRGEYESLAVQEYYGNDEEKREQDLGDRRINIFPDPEEHDRDNEDDSQSNLRFNPLMLNPPTPQPVLSDTAENTDPIRRAALSDNPNLSHNSKAQVPVPDFEDIEEKKSSRKRNKMAAYQSLRKSDSDDEDEHLSTNDTSPGIAEGDRQGRVVSNSGADTARLGVVAGVGASLSSYGSYIAGLGVGRRRDVSGKVAEEGRSGADKNESPSPSPTQSKGSEPVRAAGWARFAGL
ncbi:hypothetical protein N7474_011198 [Penicillium riverlandense]|uniref:uncharacterized protein n=1 Tax=Penicillium riverlandense TaxID=1903569 RepID=UPI00254740A1|nr:uncharacterized protein N7474_011198 [Penicillium riverlandense]KAJ5805311.1 hypothetical protein N7474_011198 [Penicillium riverlandense]